MSHYIWQTNTQIKGLISLLNTLKVPINVKFGPTFYKKWVLAILKLQILYLIVLIYHLRPEHLSL